MIDNIINWINEQYTDRLTYLSEVNGLCRRAVKFDGKKKTTLPAVINTQDCSTDKEMYIVLKREKKAVIFWELIGDMTSTEINSRLEKVNTRARMYVWLNTKIINAQKTNAGDWFNDFFSAMPKKTNSITGVFQLFINNPTFKTSGKEFKTFDFNEMIDVKPYVNFCIDFNLEFYTNKSCITLITEKFYNKCEEEIV
jgi:hypothetical protein